MRLIEVILNIEVSHFGSTNKDTPEFHDVKNRFHATCNSQPYKRQPREMIKHTQTIRWQLPTNCLSVFDNFVGLALKGLSFVLLVAIQL